MGLTGKTKSFSNVNSQTEGLQKGLSQYLMGLGFEGWNPATMSADDPALAPYREMFADQNAFNFAQAKESAGNLTGSGFANTLGSAAARANSEQGAFLANMMEQRRRADADRYVGLLLGNMNSQAAGRQLAYQPGFLDYAIAGAGKAAQGGAFSGGSPGASAGASGGTYTNNGGGLV